MSRLFSHPLISLLCRLFLGGIFIYAAIEKIRHPDLFAEAVHNYRLLPIPLENLMAIGLPWIELGIGILLAAGLLTRSGALILGSLLVIFIIAIGINLWRGVDMACGCFTLTGTGRHIAQSTLFEDLLFLLPAVQLFLFPFSTFSIDSLLASKTSSPSITGTPLNRVN